jgi:hypothetical protein
MFGLEKVAIMFIPILLGIAATRLNANSKKKQENEEAVQLAEAQQEHERQQYEMWASEQAQMKQDRLKKLLGHDAARKVSKLNAEELASDMDIIDETIELLELQRERDLAQKKLNNYLPSEDKQVTSETRLRRAPEQQRSMQYTNPRFDTSNNTQGINIPQLNTPITPPKAERNLEESIFGSKLNLPSLPADDITYLAENEKQLSKVIELERKRQQSGK